MKYVKPLCLDSLNSLTYVYIYLRASVISLYLSSSYQSSIYLSSLCLLSIYLLSSIYLSIIHLSIYHLSLYYLSIYLTYLSIYLRIISSYRQSSITQFLYAVVVNKLPAPKGLYGLMGEHCFGVPLCPRTRGQDSEPGG